MYGNYEMMRRLAKDRTGDKLAQAQSSRQASQLPRSAGLIGKFVSLLRRLVAGRRARPTATAERRVTGGGVASSLE